MAGPEPSNAGDAEGERGDATAHPVLVWCEVCGKEEWTAPAMAFASGWDFAGPGGLYPLGVVSPRTCGGWQSARPYGGASPSSECPPRISRLRNKP